MRRVLAVAGWTAFGFVTFTAAAVFGVTLHAGAPAFRRVATSIANDVLADVVAGKIVVGDVEVLDVGRRGVVRARTAEIVDPDGMRVILATNVDASIELHRLLSSLASGNGIVIDVPDVKIGDADVLVERSAAASGKLRLARTFEARPKPAATPATTANKPAGPPPRVHLGAIVIEHARVHAELLGGAPLDGEARSVRARFALDDATPQVWLDHAEVTLDAPRAPGQLAPVVAQVKGTLVVDPRGGSTLRAEAEATGSCADVPLAAHATLDGEDLDGTVDVARTEPAAFARALAGWPLTAPAEAHAHVHGKLPVLTIEARAGAGTGEALAHGTIDLSGAGEKAFSVDVDASRIDARVFGGGGETDLGGKIHAEGTLAGGPAATFHVASIAGSAFGQPVPPIKADGRFAGSRVDATFTASEPGLDASGQGSLDLATKIATYDVRARSSSLRAMPRMASVAHIDASGAATVRVRGTLDVPGQKLRGSVDASADGFAVDMFGAKHLEAHGALGGPPSAPVLDLQFTGDELRLQAKDKKPLVYPEASGKATLAFAPSPHLLGAEVTVSTEHEADHEREHGKERRPAKISASAREVRLGGGAIQSSGLTVSGLGAPLELDVSGAGSGWNIRARSDGVDLHRAARVTGIAALEALPPGTRATVDVDIHQALGGPTGHLDVLVRAEKLLGDGDVLAEAHATVDRGKLVGDAKVAAEGFGQVEITRAELVLPDRMDARSLVRTTGTVELKGALDLAQGGALFAGERVERMAGIASFEGRIERGDPDALPMVRATVRTNGLEVVLASLGDDRLPREGSQSTTIGGIDVMTHVAWDGKTDDAEVAFLSWDAQGPLGTAEAKAKVPLVAWATAAPKAVRLRDLADLDVGVAIDVPHRDLGTLPAFLRVLGVKGEVEGEMRASGKLEKPEVVANARLSGLTTTRASVRGAAAGGLEPVDATLSAHWGGDHAAITFGFTERPAPPAPKKRGPRPLDTAGLPGNRRAPEPERQPGHVRGLVLGEVRAKDLLERRGDKPLPWTASVRVEGENVSLSGLPLSGRPTGIARFSARVTDLNAAASFQGTAHVDKLGASGATIDSVDATIGGRDGSLFANVNAADASTTSGGKASFQVASQSLRIRGVDVSWDDTAPTRIDYLVQDLRLALAAPLVRRSISELDGVVGGLGNITLDGSSQTFEGGLNVQGATLYVNALGEEISGLAATARFEKSGTWRIEGATGKVGTGEFTAEASGRMKGLTLLAADATLTASKGGIPLSSEAATFAEAKGQVTIHAQQSDDKTGLVATVEIPKADVGLPDKSPQKLEPLTDDPTVTIGVRRKNGSLDTSVVKKPRRSPKPAATDPTTSPMLSRVTVTLGKEVRLEGRGIDVALGGQTQVQLSDPLKVTGRIDLHSGSIEFHGRRFTIDHGTVSFLEGGDASNPTVVVAAYWDSPDGTKVWVEFTGPLKTGTLTLRSEPPFSKTEILSVLLFGRPDPNQASAGAPEGQSGDTSGATAIGTGIVADDLNRVLSDIDENLDIETDTLEGNRARTKLGRSFLDRRLKVQIGYAPGSSYREPDSTYVFLNWQFVPKWSLVATRGDKGTSILDVLFQHRY
jgi:translocation and assembly module TamB